MVISAWIDLLRLDLVHVNQLENTVFIENKLGVQSMEAGFFDKLMLWTL